MLCHFGFLGFAGMLSYRSLNSVERNLLNLALPFKGLISEVEWFHGVHRSKWTVEPCHFLCFFLQSCLNGNSRAALLMERHMFLWGYSEDVAVCWWFCCSELFDYSFGLFRFSTAPFLPADLGALLLPSWDNPMKFLAKHAVIWDERMSSPLFAINDPVISLNVCWQ